MVGEGKTIAYDLLSEPQCHSAINAQRSGAPTVIAMPQPRRNEPAPSTLKYRDHPARNFRASPLARRVAEEVGIGIKQMHGNDPESKITKCDIDKCLRERQLFRIRRLVKPAEGVPGTHQELSKMRKSIALRMSTSNARSHTFM